MYSLLIPAFNFSLFLIFLIFKFRSPVRSWIFHRHQYIRDEIQLVQSHLREAQKEYEEVVSRLKGIDGELVLMRDQVKKEITDFEQTCVKEAHRRCSFLMSDAKNAVDRLFFGLRVELSREYGMEVLGRAEVMFEENHAGLRTTDRFLEQIREVAL
jgi:F0F1-type ATP synthase membrane subunit b/b'